MRIFATAGIVPETTDTSSGGDMFRSIVIAATGIAGLCLIATTGHAALVTKDFQTQGDGLLTLDTASGLEWLDSSVTTGMTLQQFLDGQGNLTAAGFFAVSPAQFETLLNHAGVNAITAHTFTPTTFTAGNRQGWALMQSLGVVGPSSCTSGLGTTLGSAVEFWNDTRHLYNCTLRGSTEAAIGYMVALAVHNEWEVPALARNTVVPIPPAGWLLGTALAGLGGRRYLRRRAH